MAEILRRSNTELINRLLERSGVEQGSEIVFCCPFHADSNPSCSYNTAKDLFTCFSCGEAGRGVKLLTRLNEEVGTSYPNNKLPTHSNPSKAWPVTNKNYVDLCSRFIFSKAGKPGLDYLQRRGFSFDTVTQAKLGYDSAFGMVTIPYFVDDRLAFIKTRFIGKATEDGEKYGAATKGTLVPYGIWLNKGSKDVVITEGELDALSFRQIVPGMDVLAIPGKDVFKETWLKYFESYDTVYLCLDSEVKTEDSVRELAKLLGEYRCREVKLPHKDVNDCLLARMTEIEMRQCLRDSKALGSALIRTLGSFHDEAVEAYIKGKQAGLSTGHDLIDATFGGFREGELTVLSAYPGTGKTTLALEIAKNIASHSRVMLGMFENNSSAETIPNLAGLCRGKPFFGIANEDFPKFIANIPEFENIDIVDRFSTVSDQELSQIFRMATQRGAKLLVLDHLHFFTEGRFDVNNIVKKMDLITKLARHEYPTLATLLIVQPTKPGMNTSRQCPFTQKWMPFLDLHSIKGGTTVIENANNVLLLQRDGKGVYLESAKVRSNATLAKAGEVKARVDFDKANFKFNIEEYKEPKPSTGASSGWEW